MLSCSVMTPWTVAYQVPMSMGFPRQEFWNGLQFPSPGDLPDPRIKSTSLGSPARQADSLFVFLQITVNLCSSPFRRLKMPPSQCLFFQLFILF